MTNRGLEELSVADVSWLRPVWESYGRKVEFDILRGDLPTQYPDLLDMLLQADPNVVEAWPKNEFGTDQEGQPNAMSVRIKPLGVKLLREQPREVHRQVTVDGKKVDLRSGWNHMILTSDIENLELLAYTWLRQLHSLTQPTLDKELLKDKETTS